MNYVCGSSYHDPTENGCPKKTPDIYLDIDVILVVTGIIFFL